MDKQEAIASIVKLMGDINQAKMTPDELYEIFEHFPLEMTLETIVSLRRIEIFNALPKEEQERIEAERKARVEKMRAESRAKALERKARYEEKQQQEHERKLEIFTKEYGKKAKRELEKYYELSEREELNENQEELYREYKYLLKGLI